MHNKENRNIKKSFRFTRSEWFLIQKKCKAADITPTQYIQQIAISGRTAKKNCIKEQQKYLAQITTIGNNINQIARKLNTNNKIEFWMLRLLLKIENHLNQKWLS